MMELSSGSLPPLHYPFHNSPFFFPTTAPFSIQLLATFEHRSHLCLVFEPLHMNLKEVQNKFGKGVGISIVAVRSYAKQVMMNGAAWIVGDG